MKNMFELLSGLLPENPVKGLGLVPRYISTESLLGSGESPPPCPPQEGAPTGKGRLPKWIYVEFFLGLWQQFLVRAPSTYRIKLL